MLPVPASLSAGHTHRNAKLQGFGGEGGKPRAVAVESHAQIQSNKKYRRCGFQGCGEKESRYIGESTAVVCVNCTLHYVVQNRFCLCSFTSTRGQMYTPRTTACAYPLMDDCHVMYSIAIGKRKQAVRRGRRQGVRTENEKWVHVKTHHLDSDSITRRYEAVQLATPSVLLRRTNASRCGGIEHGRAMRHRRYCRRGEILGIVERHRPAR